MRAGRVMRAPVGVYRAGLGFLFGQRFLMLEHVGRRSGRRRYAVLEVIGRPGPGRYLVACGYGPTANWFRNISATPAVRVSVGRLVRQAATARVLPDAEAAPVLAEYLRRHAVALRRLRPVLSKVVPALGGDPDLVPERMPLVELTFTQR